MSRIRKFCKGLKDGSYRFVMKGGKVLTVLVAGGVILAVAEITRADDPTFTPTSITTLTNVINPATFQIAAMTVGAVALGAAFTVGGGFRVGKKLYSWVFSKM